MFTIKRITFVSDTSNILLVLIKKTNILFSLLRKSSLVCGGLEYSNFNKLNFFSLECKVSTVTFDRVDKTSLQTFLHSLHNYKYE